MIKTKIINQTEKNLIGKTFFYFQFIVLTVLLSTAYGCKKTYDKQELAQLVNKHFGENYVLDTLTDEFFASFYYQSNTDYDLIEEFYRGNTKPLDQFISNEMPILGDELAEAVLNKIIYSISCKLKSSLSSDNLRELLTYVSQKSNNRIFKCKKYKMENGKMEKLIPMHSFKFRYEKEIDNDYLNIVRTLYRANKKMVDPFLAQCKEYYEKKDYEILLSIDPLLYSLFPKKIQEDPTIKDYLYLSQLRGLVNKQNISNEDIFNYRNKLQKLDIDFLSRLKSKKILDHVIDTRFSYKGRNVFNEKNSILMYYPKSDYNSAFNYNNIEEIIEDNNRLYYFEIAEQKAFIQTFIDVLENQINVDTLWLGGHGDGRSLGIFDLSNTDLFESLPYHLRKRIKVIVLDGCLAGVDMEDDNFAEFLRKFFPNATIFASKTSFSGGVDLEYSKKAGITAVTYGEDKNNTLVLNPK